MNLNPAGEKKKDSLKESIMAKDLSELRGNLNLHAVPFSEKQSSSYVEICSGGSHKHHFI